MIAILMVMAGVVLLPIGLVGSGLGLLADLYDKRRSRTRDMEQARLQIAADTLRIKRELDAKAFETRQALLSAANAASRNLER
jgi:hypothetical protein